MKQYTLNIFAEDKNNLEQFLNCFYNSNLKLDYSKFQKNFENPIDMIEIISTLIDNNEKYPFGIWVSIDKDIFINISENNLDKIIRYLFERYPY